MKTLRTPVHGNALITKYFYSPEGECKNWIKWICLKDGKESNFIRSTGGCWDNPVGLTSANFRQLLEELFTNRLEATVPTLLLDDPEAEPLVTKKPSEIKSLKFEAFWPDNHYATVTYSDGNILVVRRHGHKDWRLGPFEKPLELSEILENYYQSCAKEDTSVVVDFQEELVTETELTNFFHSNLSVLDMTLLKAGVERKFKAVYRKGTEDNEVAWVQDTSSVEKRNNLRRSKMMNLFREHRKQFGYKDLT